MLLTTTETLHRLGIAALLTLVLLAGQQLSAINSQSLNPSSVGKEIAPVVTFFSEQ
jgi:hypothetical protein